MLRITCRTGLALGTILLLMSGIAHAQPGQPVVQIRPDFSVVVSYSAPTSPPATGALLVATLNGAPVSGSPFNIGQTTTVTSGALPLGLYTVQVLWGTQASPVTAFTLSADLGAPHLRAAGVDLNTVSLAWDPGTGAAAGYDIEAVMMSTGQVFSAQLGSHPGVTVRGVYPGTYSVRIRARNAFAVSAYSNAIEVRVGQQFPAVGDMQATLTWNSTADMDLHLIEPDLTHVYYGNMQGASARLDFDDVDGFGPENMFVSAGRSLPGIYQIYIVHSGQNVETTSTVSVTLAAGTNVARTLIFSRRSRRAAPGTAVLVAMVNVRTGEVVEMVGTAGDPFAADSLEAAAKPK